jgi:hypothetical protein
VGLGWVLILSNVATFTTTIMTFKFNTQLSSNNIDLNGLMNVFKLMNHVYRIFENLNPKFAQPKIMRLHIRKFDLESERPAYLMISGSEPPRVRINVY